MVLLITFMPDMLDQSNAVFESFRADWIKMELLPAVLGSNSEFDIFGVRRVPKGTTFMPDMLDQSNAVLDSVGGDWIKIVLLIISMPA